MLQQRRMYNRKGKGSSLRSIEGISTRAATCLKQVAHGSGEGHCESTTTFQTPLPKRHPLTPYPPGSTTLAEQFIELGATILILMLQ
eukprot:746057-Hanusia_phi.AAC.1